MPEDAHQDRGDRITFPSVDRSTGLRRRLVGMATRRRRLRRRVVLEAAAEHFAQHGFHATNVEAVAAQAETSKPEVYRLFPSKLDLYGAVLRRERAKLARGVIAPLSEAAAPIPLDPTAAALGLAEMVFDYHRDRPHSLRVLFGAQNWRMLTPLRLEARDSWIASFETYLGRCLDHAGAVGPESLSSSRGEAAGSLARVIVTAALGAIAAAYDQRISLLDARVVVLAAARAVATAPDDDAWQGSAQISVGS